MSLRLAPPLPAGTPGHPGLTGPGSVTWRVCRERVVNGSLQQDVGEWRRGTRYSATSPELCLWVYATIIETTLDSYSTFVHPLDMNERAELYRESERFGPAGSGPAPLLGPLSRGRGALPPGRRPECRSAEHRCGLW
jgi:uncharacterized protein (DUF2236 family)